jgi:hypothetical protein
MAKHKFDGEWSYYDVDGGNFPPQPPNGPQKVILKVDDDGSGKGQLKPGSKHNGLDLTGEAFPGRLVMRETGGGEDNSLEGLLIFENGGRLLMVGNWFDNTSLANKRAHGKFLDDGQADGTWVMTKP